MELRKSMMKFVDEYNEYFCIKRINDNRIALDNTNSPGNKTIAFINFPILFKNKSDIIRYLIERVGEAGLPLYTITTFGSMNQKETSIIIGEYVLDE